MENATRNLRELNTREFLLLKDPRESFLSTIFTLVGFHSSLI